MADYQFGQTPSTGSRDAGFDSAVTIQFDFWQITVNFNILTYNDSSGYGNTTTQAGLNKIVEVISQNGQPVLLNNPTFNSTTGVSTLIFGIEHQLSWNLVEGSPKPVYGLGAAGAATDNGAAALKAALVAGLVNVTYQSSYSAWATGTIAAGTVVSSSSNYYICVLGGTATTGNAPTGTGTSGTVAITTADGLVWWYLAATSAGTPPSVANLVNTPTYFAVLP